MSQRLTSLAVLGNMLYDEPFADSLLSAPSSGAVIQRLEGLGVQLQPIDAMEIGTILANLAIDEPAVRQQFAAIRDLLGCPRRPCPKGLQDGGLRVPALLGNACVCGNFRDAFLADPVGAAVALFGPDALPADDRAELESLAPDLVDRRTSLQVIFGTLLHLLRCPRGCPGPIGSNE